MSARGSNSTEGSQQLNRIILQQREPLLKTKLFIPPIRATRVGRPGLTERVNSGTDKALILISAPAGFGKTTLLAEWAAQAGLPVAWLSLDEGDNDPNRFLRYVIAALNKSLVKTEAGICATAQAMLQSVQPTPIQTILVALINDLTDLSESFALVLDDYQFITSTAVNEVLAFILEHLPPQMHLVIASRVDPSLPLHRLRVAQRLLEIRTDELRFSADETDAFMNTVMELGLPEQDITILTDRTEGWIAGLQMAALSMRCIDDRSAFVRALSGSHRYILEYLLEEVLDRQPEKIQAFLLQTSILDSLCSPLYEALLEDQGDSQNILDHLYRSNIFITPLDDIGYWYRYHHLFADLLRARLQRSYPDRLPTLHLRASQWYEDAGLPEQAIRHALAAKDVERAARLVEQSAVDIMSRGELSSLLRLFEALPEDLIHDRPALGVYYAWALTFSGQFNSVESQILLIENQISTGDSRREAKEILGSIAIIRGLIADYRGNMASAIELARRADEQLPEGKLAERSIIPFVLGDGYTATGELDKAEQAFEKIHKIGLASGNLWTVSVALHKLALVKKLQGKLRQVESLYQEAIQFASERGGQRYGSMGATYVGLSDLLRERNELEAARQMVTQAIEDMERWHNPTDQVNGYVTLARIALAQGDIVLSQIAVEKAKEISSKGSIFPLTRKTLEACQIRLWLAQGDLVKVNQWAGEKRLDNEDISLSQELDFLSELEWISIVRVFIARSELDRAIQMLSILAEAAESAGHCGRLIEIYVLTALALHGSGKRDQAQNILTKSLVLAEPEIYERIFLDEGEPMEELLQVCRSRVEGTRKAYINKLLKAFSISSSGEQAGITTFLSQPDLLIEPLTKREAEVLRLLAAGLSNQEIAEELVLSEGTVKTHTHNLYGKLGVQSRTRALARAKELNLL